MGWKVFEIPSSPFFLFAYNTLGWVESKKKYLAWPNPIALKMTKTPILSAIGLNIRFLVLLKYLQVLERFRFITTSNTTLMAVILKKSFDFFRMLGISLSNRFRLVH